MKPYIQKFFLPGDGSPIYPKDHPLLWLIIKPYMEYKVGDGLSVSQRKKQVTNLPGKLTIALPQSKVKLYGLGLRESSIVNINMLFEHLFAKELYWHVYRCEFTPGRYKGYNRAIEEFCWIHNIEIETDISMESLLNFYKRYRQKYLITIGSKNVSRLPAA